MSKAAELAALIGSQTALSNRNLIINGAMQVAQRGTSFTGQGANGSPYFTDRWYVFSGGTSAGRFTATQEAITDLSGFTQALKLDCTTADTSIGADEQLTVIQAVEAQNLQHLKFGTSDAVPLTYSFYAKANAAKTYIAELYAIDGTAKSQSHAFNVTTSWQRFEITFSATGADAATIDNNNGVGLYVNINLHSGSNLTSGTINSTWAAATQANRHVGCDSFYSSTDNTFFLTGAQLEVGEQATPFEHRSFGDDLAMCQRYFQKSYAYGTALGTFTAIGAMFNREDGTVSNRACNVKFPVEMRDNTTTVVYSLNGTSGAVSDCGTGFSHSSNVTGSSFSGTDGPSGLAKLTLGTATNDIVGFHYTADAEL